jgi:hypothetical protein
MDKLFIKVVVGLIVAAVCTAGTAVVKVSVLEEKVKSDHELIKETNENVKMLIKFHLEK